MKMVKSLLLGSAAGLFAVAGAQAADLPVKAKPVEYVKVCSLYGAGFFYVPGTDTCLKVGGYARFNARWDTAGVSTLIQNGGPGSTLLDRRDTANSFGTRGRGILSLDARTPTPWGVVRAYMLVGATVDTEISGAPAATLLRAFVQWNGFTAGRAVSPFGGVSFSSPATGYMPGLIAGNTGGVPGLNVLYYTLQLGGGFSASLGLDDPAGVGGRVVNANVAGAMAVGAAYTNSQATYRMPNFAANINYTSPQMQAQIGVAVQDVSGSYYACGGSAAANQTVACGHPSDNVGWAANAGILFTGLAAIGRPLDWFGVSGSYSQGAGSYSGSTIQTNPFRVNPGSIVAPGSMGYGLDVNGVYGVLGGVATGMQLTEKFAVEGGYDIGWTPNLRTSIYADYLSVRYNATAKALICQGNIATSAGSVGAIFGTGNTFSACNPDFQVWSVGSRFLQWKPIPDLEIGFDVKYQQLVSANKGGTFTNTAAIGARNAGTSLVQDQGIWSAIMQVNRNFFP